jgi:NAD(P)-dependent dehydrogenase (short-subunit alcohol dehydrogenase family)
MATRLQKARNAVVDRMVNPMRLTDERALRRAVAGKTVLVTGASYGLGEATARLLAREGATVLAVARTAERLDELVAGIEADGGRAVAYRADLSDFDAIGPLVDRMIAEHGGIDIVVNNAGKSMRRSLDLQYDRFHDFTRMVNVNYLGPVRLLLAVLPHMRERGSGLVVNVSTIGVRIPPGPRWGVYQSTKSAFDIWLRSITPEIQPDGVDVSTIYMALMYTRMSAPTPIMRRLPGLSATEAAGLVARAIVGREREITPWWVMPAQTTDALARGPMAWGMRLLHRHSDDTASARGVAPQPQPQGRGAGS